MSVSERSVSLREVEHLIAKARALSERVAVYNQRVVGEGNSLAEEITELRKEIASSTAGAKDEAVLDELRRAKAVLEGHGPGGDLRKLVKQQSPILLRLLVGHSTNVVTLQRNEAIRLKEEYHAFRDRMAFMLFAVSLGLLVADLLRPHSERFTLTPPFMVCVQVFLCWLLYVYTALALRENVLKVNGSGIRAWWIRHHYWSIATCMLVLTLPVDSPSVQMFVKKWIWWSCWQGALMMLQNRYQRRRMYTRIALGKNRAMDVVSGESSGGSGQLLLLYPLIFGLQAFQMLIGAQMLLATARAFSSPEGWLDLESHESDLRGSRGIAIAGSLMLYMGLLNFKNTAGTIVEKAIRRRQIRRGITPLSPPSTMIQKASEMPQQTELTSSKKPEASAKAESVALQPTAEQNHEENAEHVSAQDGKVDAAVGARDGSDVSEKLKDSPGGLHAIREEDKPVAANPSA